MAQHDYSIANQSGAAFRSDLNNALSAIVTNNSGATTPTTTYAFQMWADTTAGVMKLRNAANSAWITLYQLDGEWSSIAFENGSAAAPSIYFKDSGTDTGLYSPGTDQVAISTGGTGRLFVNSSGSVGIGTSSPSTNTEINAALDTGAGLALNEGQLSIGREANSGGAVRIGYDTTNNFGFISSGRVGVSWDKLILNAGGGSVGIGTTDPGSYFSDARNLVIESGTDTGITIRSSTTTKGTIAFADGTSGADAYRGYVAYSHSDNSLAFATNGTEAVKIDSSRRLLVGTSTSVQVYQGATAFNSEIQVAGSSASLTIARSIGSGNLFLARNQTVTSGSPLGVVSFNGGDGTNLIQAAQISAEVDGTPGTNDMPGRLVFSTTADGASSPTERMRITSAGGLWVGNTTRQNTSNHSFIAITEGDWIASFQCNTATAANNLGILINYSGSAPNNTTSEYFRFIDSTATRASMRSNGGLANYQANNVNLSDINTKKDITPAAGTWDCIKEWEIVNYRYKDQPDDADLNLGVIAQQVVESCPEVITVFSEATEDQPEKLGIKEQQMYWMAIKALQEAQVRIEALEDEVAALKAQ